LIFALMPEFQVSLNGVLVPYQEATIHIGSAAMKYGASVFEGIRGYWCQDAHHVRLLELDAHLKRLIDSMKLMRMETTYSVDQLRSLVEDLVVANRMCQDSYVRIAASISGQGGIDETGPVLLSIVQLPKGRHPKYQLGIEVSISAWTRISDSMMPPRLKCVANYQNGRLAKLQARLDGYDDTLLQNQLGHVSEAPTACFCLVRAGEVLTPPPSADVLPSITRALLFRIAPTDTILMREREITRTECYLADEAFLCGTGAEVVPVVSIDRHPLGNYCPGPITNRLRSSYECVAYGRAILSPDPAVTIEL
jgi:branched-chain amino acid aminotransferase